MLNLSFSVLIPVYNVENFISECVDSVLAQTYQNFEIILVDDGSTDSSGIICDKYAITDTRIKTYHQDNQGHLMTRGFAVSKAKGDFCLFLDSDDYWDPDLLENINQNICEFNCDLIIYKIRKVTDKGQFISETKSLFDDKTLFVDSNKEILLRKILNSSDLNSLVCKVIKRSIIEKDNTDYSLYMKIKNGEDLLQSLPLLFNAKKILYIDKSMYNYRMSPNSITRTLNINLLRDITVVRSVVLGYIEKFELDSKDNLNIFYQNYIETLLKNISVLITSDISLLQKEGLLQQLKGELLFKSAVGYFDISNLPLRNKIDYYLVTNNYFYLLFTYNKFLNFLRRIKKMF